MRTKLARSQMRAYTLKLLAEQGGRCLVCDDLVDIKIPKEGVLDHDHQTGAVRGVLHRWCNSQLGKVENAAIRGKRNLNYVDWLERAIHYIKTADTPYLYPTHKTEEEKRAARNLKERKRRAQQKATAVLKKCQEVR